MTGFNSTRFINDESHFVVENYNPTLSHGTAQDKVRSVTRNELYEDVLKYVAENYDPHFITLNIPAENVGGPTIEWLDKRTLQLSPGNADAAVDYKVILTSDETVFEKIDNTGTNYNQKTYNEYVYPQAVYAELLKDHSIIEFDSSFDGAGDAPDRVSTIYLKNQLYNLNDYSQITTLTDSLFILNRIDSVQSDIDNTKDLVVSIYNSRRFGDYVVLTAATADYDTTIPTAGQCVIEDKDDNDITKIKFSAYSFPELYLTDNTIPPDYSDATIYNNYLANDFDSSVLRIQDYEANEERSYALDKGAANADLSIFKYNQGAADEYFEMQVRIKTNNATNNLKDLNPEAVKVHMYRDTVGADLLGNYVKKLGDTMTGDLVMSGANIKIETGKLEFEVNGAEDYITDLDNRFSKIVSRAPKDLSGVANVDSRFGIQIDLKEGNTFKNNLKVSSQTGDIVTVTSGVGAQIEFATSGFTPNYTNTGLTKGIAIRHIPTPNFEDSPGDIAVNKEYVDQQDQLLLDQLSSGECVNINGGLLCAGDVHPKFMDTLRNPSLVKVEKINDNPDIDISSYTINGNIDSENVIYRTTFASNNRTKEIFKTNYVTQTQEVVGKIYGHSFYNDDYTKRVNINHGTVSHDQKYVITGTTFGGYSPSGPHDSVTQYIWLSTVGTDNYRDISVTSGRTGSYHPTSMISTGPRPDSESGYMIGCFYAEGKYPNSSTTYYNHRISIYKYGDSRVTLSFTPSQIFKNSGDSVTANVCRGNPKYDEVFIVSQRQYREPIYKVQFGDIVNDTTIVEHTPREITDYIRNITYLPRSKRYYMGGYNTGYLTQPYDGPLDNKWHLGAIKVEIPQYHIVYKGSNSYPMTRYSGDIAAFEFGSEIVVMGRTNSQTLYNPNDSTDRITFKGPQAVMIYDGSEAGFKRYESTAPQDEYNDLDDWEGNDFSYDQSIDYRKFDGHEVDSVPQHYGYQSVRVKRDVEFLTPGINQPYTQPLYWNNELVQIETAGEIEVDDLDFEKELVSATYGIDTIDTLRNSQNSIQDGYAYTATNNGPTQFNYQYIWFTNKWIQNKFEQLNINNAYDAKVVNMSGSFASTETLGEVVAASRGGPLRYNNIDGILVRLSSEIRSSKKAWQFSMPGAFQVFLPYSEVDPLMQIDLS